MNKGFAGSPGVGGNPNKNAPPKKLSKKSAKRVFIRLSRYVLGQWYLFIPAILLTLLSNQLSLMGPDFSGKAIDAISAPDGVNYPVVWDSVVKMLLCYLVAALLSYLLSVLMIRLSQRIVYAMRKSLFEKLTTLPVGYFDSHQTGDIISHLSYDIDTINASLSHDLVQIMTSVYTVVGSLIFMWQISKPLIAVFALTVPVSILFTRFRSKRVRPLLHKRAACYGAMNGYAEEMFSGGRTIRSYHREEAVTQGFDRHNDAAMDAYYAAEYYSAALGPSVNFINNLSISLVTMFGGVLYMLSQSGAAKAGSLFFITLGGVAQFVQYSRKFAGPINEFANILHEFQSAFSAADRVFAVMDEPSETPDPATPWDPKEIHGEVELRNVSFGYTPERSVLKGVNLQVKPGSTIAIVGPTGAGKTTVINLLMRFYDVNSGAILLDGEDIRHYRRSRLRESFTMVLQDTWLFCGTVYENIAYGNREATREQVEQAAKAARIHNFITHLPEGYDTVLTDDGVNISKGQKQLITIARAMLNDSKMLILDEATSNVDSRTEILIGEAMAELRKGRTCFIIAHRLSTIKDADLILVVKDGKIFESGTHDELLALKGFYSTLYNSQFE